MTKYYTLLHRDSDDEPWYPEFGDYDCQTVHEEKESYLDKWQKVIVSGDKQSEIDAAVNELNKSLALPIDMIDATYDDMVQHLNLTFPDADQEELEWDIASAIYWLSYGWHGGKSSNLYSAGCQTEYKPALATMSIADEEYGARQCYNELVNKFGIFSHGQ